MASPPLPVPANGASPPQPPPPSLKDMILTKEHELSTLHDYRITSLSSLVSEKSTALASLLTKFNQLKGDFEYNLTLIAGRDEELRRYESYISDAHGIVKNKDAEIKNLIGSLEEQDVRRRNDVTSAGNDTNFYKSKCADLIRSQEDERVKMERDRESLIRQLEEVSRQNDPSDPPLYDIAWYMTHTYVHP